MFVCLFLVTFSCIFELLKEPFGRIGHHFGSHGGLKGVRLFLKDFRVAFWEISLIFDTLLGHLGGRGLGSKSSKILTGDKKATKNWQLYRKYGKSQKL